LKFRESFYFKSIEHIVFEFNTAYFYTLARFEPKSSSIFRQREFAGGDLRFYAVGSHGFCGQICKIKIFAASSDGTT